MIKIIPAITGLAFVLITTFFISKNITLPNKAANLIEPVIKVKTAPTETPIPQLSLDLIFGEEREFVKSLPKEKIRVLVATGDIIPARSVNFQVATRNDFTWPYQKTFSILKDADITFINLEAPLVKNCPVTQVGMIFCGDQRNIEGMKLSGVDIASLANNHAGNYGKEGVEETVNLLSQNNILATGVDGAAIKDVTGLKFAFLGYNDVASPQPGVSNVDEERMRKEIAQARMIADVVAVAFHWGNEYVSQPNQRQKSLAHLAIDSGADLIIGNHPHWIQPVEIYQGKVITYAHGNFIFDQMWSQKTREGVVGKYTFLDKELVDIQFFPIQINDFGQPNPVEGEQGQNILHQMKDKSLKFSSGVD